MITYTSGLTLLQRMTKVDSGDTTNNAFLVTLWNDSIRVCANIRGGNWKFLEYTKTIATVNNQSSYAIPGRMRKISDIYCTVGTTVYRPTFVYDAQEWSKILSAQLAASNIPLFVFPQGSSFLVQPASQGTTGTFTVVGRKQTFDIGIADVTTSTVTTIAAGGTVITINAGGLASMAGKYIQITATGAANTGDGVWYEIASATATTITLVAPYEGTAISAGTAACTIGQPIPLPEAYQMAPIYRTMALFSQVNDPLHSSIANGWWEQYDGGNEAGKSKTVGGLVGQMLENEGQMFDTPYLSPNPRESLDPNYPPRSASGFN